MANFQPVSNSTIKTQLAGKFRQRWNTISRLTGQNQWLVEDAKFILPKLSKTGKQQILTIKCPQHVIDVIHEIYDGDVRWKKWRPEMSGQRHYAQYDSYSGTKQKPPGPNDLYVDTLWPDTKQFPNWSDRDSFVPSLKSKYQVIRFLKSGKTVKEDGTSVSSSDMTKLQETGSAIVFKHVIIGKLANKQINEARDIIKVKEVKDELNALWQSIAHTNCDMEWVNNFYKQQKALLKALKKYPGGNDFEEFERDGPFMNFITQKIIGVNNVLGIKGKDNWNPADIWLIKKRSKHIDNLTKLMDTPMQGYGIFRKRLFAAKIEQFNNEMRAMFKEKEIWGISLKLVTQDEAKWEFVNVEDDYFTELSNKTFSLGSGQTYGPVCKLATESADDGGEKFVTQDSILWVIDGNKQYKFQIKANTSTKRDNLKYESTQKGFGAARLGKATAAFVEGLLDAYEDKHIPATWKNFKKSHLDYPGDEVELEKWEEKITAMAKFLSKKGVDLGEYEVGDGTHKVKPEDVYDRMLGVMKNDKQRHVANSKLMQMSWLCCVLSIKDSDNDGIREFLTDLVFISKKEGKQYGPFLKLY
tara:strand:+ start:975 stop:2726 length:1752 start_codon:yes stop_codon:yes gene_type:complete